MGSRLYHAQALWRGDNCTATATALYHASARILIATADSVAALSNATRTISILAHGSADVPQSASAETDIVMYAPCGGRRPK